MSMLRTPFLCALTLAALLSGCASKGEGDDEPKRTWAQSWRKMREKQDHDAAAFVQTGIDTRSGPVTNSPDW